MTSTASDLIEYCIPAGVNRGPWLTAYTLNELLEAIEEAEIVLPICSLGTPFETLAGLGELVLPPLYHEALDDDLKRLLLQRIDECFPFHQLDPRRANWKGQVRIVELSPQPPSAAVSGQRVAFSVDTAVEEHGPHLPLATDRIQSYAVLRRLAEQSPDVRLVPPIDYGHLTWGLPFGVSVDTTPPLLTRYVAGFTQAVVQWLRPSAILVVDVHGSIVHRNAIVEGLRLSEAGNCQFQWLHEPLVPFAGDRGDQHAGAVETILIEHIDPALVDARWFPERREQLAKRQMSLETALRLSNDMSLFIEHVREQESNGIVGVIDNYDDLNGSQLFELMLESL